jgi:hypothetical protein
MKALQNEFEELARRGGDVAASADYQRLMAAMQEAVNDYTAEVTRQDN